MSHLATEAEADREYADNVGRERPDREWILSDRDVWYHNPFYDGPPQRHPEADYDDGERGGEDGCPSYRKEAPLPPLSKPPADIDWEDIPF